MDYSVNISESPTTVFTNLVLRFGGYVSRAFLLGTGDLVDPETETVHCFFTHSPTACATVRQLIRVLQATGYSVDIVEPWLNPSDNLFSPPEEVVRNALFLQLRINPRFQMIIYYHESGFVDMTQTPIPVVFDVEEFGVFGDNGVIRLPTPSDDSRSMTEILAGVAQRKFSLSSNFLAMASRKPHMLLAAVKQSILMLNERGWTMVEPKSRPLPFLLVKTQGELRCDLLGETVGSFHAKLPCGHLLGPNGIVRWLLTSNGETVTCPCCLASVV